MYQYHTSSKVLLVKLTDTVMLNPNHISTMSEGKGEDKVFTRICMLGGQEHIVNASIDDVVNMLQARIHGEGQEPEIDPTQ